MPGWLYARAGTGLSVAAGWESRSPSEVKSDDQAINPARGGVCRLQELEGRGAHRPAAPWISKASGGDAARMKVFRCRSDVQRAAYAPAVGWVRRQRACDGVHTYASVSVAAPHPRNKSKGKPNLSPRSGGVAMSAMHGERDSRGRSRRDDSPMLPDRMARIRSICVPGRSARSARARRAGVLPGAVVRRPYVRRLMRAQFPRASIRGLGALSTEGQDPG